MSDYATPVPWLSKRYAVVVGPDTEKRCHSTARVYAKRMIFLTKRKSIDLQLLNLPS
jgi:hypothetical protein